MRYFTVILQYFLIQSMIIFVNYYMSVYIILFFEVVMIVFYINSDKKIIIREAKQIIIFLVKIYFLYDIINC